MNNNINGSLQTKNGIYYAVLRVPTLDGKTKQIWKTTKIPVIAKTKRQTDANLKAANKFLAALISEYENKPLYSDKSFLSWCEEWLDEKKRDNKTRLITLESYQGYYNKHIKPFFEPKNLRIDEVTPRILNAYKRQKQDEGQSNNSIIKHFSVLRGVFSYAKQNRAISYNPCDDVQMPSKGEHVGHAYTPELSKRLIVAIENDPLKSCIMLALYGGLRRSECLGLRWQDVDFDENVIRVRNTVVRMNTLTEHEATKSKSSRRDNEMPEALRDYLLDLRQKQEQFKAACGDSYADTDGAITHVCVWPDGRMFSPDYVSCHFRLILKRAGLPKITFHELRHTCGSLMINGGASVKQTQDYLGHRYSSTTLDTYCHTSKDKHSESARLIDGLLKL